MNEQDMAAYLDRRLDPESRGRMEGHLAQCTECRQEMIEVRAILGRAARPRRLAVAAAGLMATAAILVLMVRPTGPESLRSEGGPGPLITYGPMGEVGPSPVRFVWGSAPGAVSYRLTLSRADGTPVWSASGTDTALTLPDSIVLSANERYFWITDALLDDGSARSTGLHQFQLGP